MANRPTFTRTQLRWIADALRHDIMNVRHEMDGAEDGSPTAALGEMFLSTRQELLDRVEDIANGTQKTFTVSQY